MQQRHWPWVVLLVLGCGTTPGRKGGEDSAPPPKSEATLAVERAVMAADIELEKATAAKGVEGWVAGFAPQAVQHHHDGKVSVGPEQIRAAMTKVFSDANFRLTWRPVKAEAIGTDLGLTVGVWETLRREADNWKVTATGKYVTIWQKQPDGRWKIIEDVGTKSAI
jgi:ketosteroid isomerase-like protein